MIDNNTYFIDFILKICKRDMCFFIFSNDLKESIHLEKLKHGYHLDWALLENSDHAIVGLICEKKPYIYDSNNIIAYSDWTKSDFSGYYDRYEDVFREPVVNFYHLAAAIYVKPQISKKTAHLKRNLSQSRNTNSTRNAK
jgi:hypothetical protein